MDQIGQVWLYNMVPRYIHAEVSLVWGVQIERYLHACRGLLIMGSPDREVSSCMQRSPQYGESR